MIKKTLKALFAGTICVIFIIILNLLINLLWELCPILVIAITVLFTFCMGWIFTNT